MAYVFISTAEYYHNNREHDVDRPCQSAITHQPSVQYVYTQSGSVQPDMVIIQPSHLPYRIVPSANNTFQGEKSSSGTTKPESPPSYSECTLNLGTGNGQTLRRVGPMENPPPYPGIPTADTKQ